MTVDADVATTTDKVLGGAVTLVQPASGAHRSGSDAVFLGSTLDDGSGLTLDLGAGCGAVGLVAAHRNPNLRVTLVETDPVQLGCAKASVAANPALAGRLSVTACDLTGPEQARTQAGLARAGADHILTNPPYRRAGANRTSDAKARAHSYDPAILDAWMRTCASLLRPSGTLTVIFSAEGLTDLLATLQGRFGAVTVLGLHPREGAAAERLLVRAIKGRRTAPRLLPGLILHEPDGAYTEAAQAILAGKRAIDLDGGP